MLVMHGQELEKGEVSKSMQTRQDMGANIQPFIEIPSANHDIFFMCTMPKDQHGRAMSCCRLIQCRGT